VLRWAGSGRGRHLRTGGLWPSPRLLNDRSNLLRLAPEPKRHRDSPARAESPAASLSFVGDDGGGGSGVIREHSLAHITAASPDGQTYSVGKALGGIGETRA
jgi:hypothetical protein